MWRTLRAVNAGIGPGGATDGAGAFRGAPAFDTFFKELVFAQEVRMRESLGAWTLRPRAAQSRSRACDRERRAAIHASRRARSVEACAEGLEARTLLAAAPVPVGDEFPVNTQNVGSQELFAESPGAVASAGDGSFVVTWASSGEDGSSWGVCAQRFGPDGQKRGTEFIVNESSANSQSNPAVASDAGGDFVVTWTSYLQDGSKSGVYARRYDAAGAPVGGEFRVNSTTVGDQRYSAVAMDADGDVVIAWTGQSQAGGDGWDVYARRYGADGAARGGEFRVNEAVSGDQQFPSVASDAAGDFVVAWTSDGVDGSGTAVCARQYGAGGSARGGEFRVNTFIEGNQQFGRVGADAVGDFVIAWASAGQDGSGRGIYAQRYLADGAPSGGEFAVNEVTAGEQFAPNVAVDTAGGFVIAWTAAEGGGGTFDIGARAYAAGGEARGGEFRVNSFTAGNQAYASVAADGAGGFVAAWESNGQDGSFFGVYAQRYAPPTVLPPAASVVGEHLFYNDSAFDGETPGADVADDGAVAPDKNPLELGRSISAANVSSYGRGINGVIVDVAALGALPAGSAPTAAGAATLTADDFDFRAGPGGEIALWPQAAAPTSITVRPGAGEGGSFRVTLIWDDGAIKNQWLLITVKANDRTRLIAPQVFCFGNLVGNAGNDGASPVVDRLDLLLTRRAFSQDPVPITDPFDYNRDGRVNALDALLVRRNPGRPALGPVQILPVAAALPPPPGDSVTGLLAGDSGSLLA